MGTKKGALLLGSPCLSLRATPVDIHKGLDPQSRTNVRVRSSYLKSSHTSPLPSSFRPLLFSKYHPDTKPRLFPSSSPPRQPEILLPSQTPLLSPVPPSQASSVTVSASALTISLLVARPWESTRRSLLIYIPPPNALLLATPSRRSDTRCSTPRRLCLGTRPSAFVLPLPPQSLLRFSSSPLPSWMPKVSLSSSEYFA